MAYREFYKPPDFPLDNFAPIGQGISNFFQGMAEEYAKRRTAADKYQYALDYGKDEDDNKFNETYTKQVVSLGRYLGKRGLQNSPALLEAETAGKRIVGDQKAQYDLFDTLNKQIDDRATKDPYYNPDQDKKTLMAARFGTYDHNIDFSKLTLDQYQKILKDRGDKLNQVASLIGNDPRAFKLQQYTADWVKGYGQKEMEQKTGSPTLDRTKFASSPFWDDKTGAPGVTDKHVLDYLNSHNGEPHDTIALQVKDQIANEADQVEKMIKQGDERVQKLKGMAPDELAVYLISHPEDNPINKTDYNQRIRDIARDSLKQAAAITTKTDVTYKDPKVINNVSEDQRNSFTDYVNDIGGTALASPGGILMQKNGNPLTIEVDAQKSYDMRSGRLSRRSGSAQFNLTGYQLVGTNKDGTLVPIDLSNPDNIPEGQLLTMNPDVTVALRGYSIDKAALLGDINREKGEMSAELGRTADADSKAELTSKIERIDHIRDQIQNDEISDEDVINAMKQNNIKTNSIRYDELVVPSKSDLSRVKSITTASNGQGGLNLADRKMWSDEMREAADKFHQKYEEVYSKAQERAKGGLSTQESIKSGEKVKVISPDGVKGSIPKANLQKALDAGYKLAE